MTRPRWIWISFGAAFGVVLLAMGWTTAMARRLERAEIEGRRNAALEESVRLALWRMDSALAPVITQEIARPSFHYGAFYAAERPYEQMFSTNAPSAQMQARLLPSPLLSFSSPFVKLHFQISASGEIGSPQSPSGAERDLAIATCLPKDALAIHGELLDQLRPLVDRDALRAALPAPERSNGSVFVRARADPPVPPTVAPPSGQKLQKPQTAQTLDNRLQTDAYQKIQESAVQTFKGSRSSASQARLNEIDFRTLNCEPGNLGQMLAANDGTPLPTIDEGLYQPVWSASALLLARRVAVEDRELVQGAWLDWPALKAWLLAGIKDLLPNADLLAAATPENASGERLLASLPVRIVPGAAPPVLETESSPMVFSLSLAWASVLLAGAAVGALLLLSLALSERRKSFVSAVTHELRTPLTTFRMYSEMLAEGMVETEEQKKSYLGRLRTEADRLSHLVENVLAYARLESGRARRHVEEITIDALITRVRPRLEDRARDGGMTLAIEIAMAASGATLRVDASAVEQVLFNLVDNACKYAAESSARTIRLCAQIQDGVAALRVEDHGPGISSAARKSIFSPFARPASRSAGAGTVPDKGVGLGLALSRRLAREMGGDLRIDQHFDGGAAFVLRLPLAR